MTNEAKRMTSDELAAAKALFRTIETLRPDRELEMKVEVVDGNFETWIQFYSALLNWSERAPALLAHIEAVETENRRLNENLALYRDAFSSLPLSAQDDAVDALAALRRERDQEHG